MRFKQFLLKEGRGKEVDLQYAKEWIEKNSPKVLENALEGNKIYRGLNNNYFAYYINPKKSTRKSAYVGSNYYTLLMDNLPLWKKYPKRSKSIVCTTDYSKGKAYGTLYLVFPKDGSKIGVCPKDDIFYSFPKLYNNKEFIYNMRDWTYHFEDLDFWMSNKKSDKSWNSMKKLFNKIDELRKKQNSLSLSSSDDKDVIYIKEYFPYLFNKGKDSLSGINQAMSPKKNGFELKKAGDIIPADREIWTDGESMLINEGEFEELFNNDPGESYDYITVNIKDLLIIWDDLQRAYSRLSNPSNRRNIPKYPIVVPFDDIKGYKYAVVEGHEAIVKALMQGKDKITVELEYPTFYYHGEDLFKYEKNNKYKGLEDFSADDYQTTIETIDDEKEEWGF